MKTKKILFALLIFNIGIANSKAGTINNVTTHITSSGFANPCSIPIYDVFEISFEQPVLYGIQTSFDSIAIDVIFTSPTNNQWIIHGFFYDTLGGNSEWKARFAPDEIGTWTYNWTFVYTTPGDTATGSGIFDCISGPNQGFLKINQTNNLRWQYANGQAFAMYGINECIDARSTTSMEGGDKSGAFMEPFVEWDDYLGIYAESGFNTFRFSQDNCSSLLTDTSFTVYDKDAATFFDHQMKLLRKHDFRIFYGLFGYRYSSNPPMSGVPSAASYRYMDYCINRWGAYVDIWQILNETNAAAGWLSAAATYIRNNDPYNHPITTSWEYPSITEIEVNAPHWYVPADELQGDAWLATQASSWKSWGKPIVLGEQGNSTTCPTPGNWSTSSAAAMRIKAWAAFFSEIHFLYWNSSYATDGMCGGAASIYLGPEERQYASVLQWFSNEALTSDMVNQMVTLSNNSLMRGYSLFNSNDAMAYIHHYSDHSNTVTGETITINIPTAGQGYWIEPSTGNVISTTVVTAGSNVLTIPDFVVDIAFLSISAGTFDTKPTAILSFTNPQADGDLDNDGNNDYGPVSMPFGMAPLTLTFDATLSNDLDGGTLTYNWDFGDGTNGTGISVAHTYAEGNFIAKLTVTDDEGNTAHQSIIVRTTGDPNPGVNDAPVLYPLPDTITVFEGEMVMFTPYANDYELTGNTYSADAVTYNVSNMPAGSTFGLQGVGWVQQFWWVPSFNQAGTYTVNIQAQDANNALSSVKNVVIKVNDADTTCGIILSTTGTATEATVSVYPNPARDILTVQGGSEALELYDMYGRLLLRSKSRMIDVSGYTRGMYVWKVGDVNGKLAIQ